MIIDEEAFNNSNFTLMAAEEISSFGDDKEVLNFLKSHNLLKKSTHLSNSKEILHITLINHIDMLYYKNKEISNELMKLIQNNGTLKTNLQKYVNKRLNTLLTDGSAIFFKEIIGVINLLSLGEKFEIFKTYNEYNFDEVSNLFRHYEGLLQAQFLKDRFNFDTTFECYIALIKAYSQLCVINATDVHRKKTINPIINAISETINMLKFTVAMEEEHLNKLNNMLGEVLFYFSHLPYIDTKDKELYYLIDEFFLLLEKQTDGFHLSKEAKFSGNEENQHKNFLMFLANSGYLLLTMIQKLNYVFSNKDYFSTRSFQKCLRLFSNNFAVMNVLQDGQESLTSFTKKLLNALVQNYQLSETSINTTIEYQKVIDDFIQTADNFHIHNIEPIHNVLLFANDIEDYKYLNIGETLVHSSLIQNDHYEFFKLKTIDIIINHFITQKSKEDISGFIKHVEYYVEQNKKASHLLSMFSKLTLSLTHYYAMLDNEASSNKARSLYSIFINTNGVDLLRNEYARINDDILVCLGKYYIHDLELNEERFSHKRIKALGKKLSQSYIDHLNLQIKYDINEQFANIISEILNNDNLNYEEIHKEISDIISNKIFYGLCEVRIKGLTKDSSRIVDSGYMLFSIPMLKESYILQFIFPAVHESAFKYILNENKAFIIKNTNNILSGFKSNTNNLIDQTSGLKNISKLKDDLVLYNGDEVLMIEILLGGMFAINKKYGFKTGNTFLRSISKKIETFIAQNDTIYYMGGGRLGIIMSSKNDHEAVVKNIKNIKIKKDGENIDMGLTIAITQTSANEILDESTKLLDKALTSKSKILFNIK